MAALEKVTPRTYDHIAASCSHLIKIQEFGNQPYFGWLQLLNHNVIAICDLPSGILTSRFI